MENYFKQFFVCPYCDKPLVGIDELANYMGNEPRYCSKCGKEIANALTEALADIKKILT